MINRWALAINSGAAATLLFAVLVLVGFALHIPNEKHIVGIVGAGLAMGTAWWMAHHVSNKINPWLLIPALLVLIAGIVFLL